MYINTPKDLVGRFYGKLQVKEYLGKRKGCHFYKVQCKCGTIEEVQRFNLRTKKRWCIPCSQKKVKEMQVSTVEDYVGTVVGKLTVLKFAGKDKSGGLFYITKCECGTIERSSKSHLLANKRTCKKCSNKSRSRRYNRIIQHLLNNLETDVEVV